MLGKTPEQMAEAQRELMRMGIDRPAAARYRRPGEWADGQPLRSYPVADFAALAAARHHRPVTVLDVRRKLEWAESHLDGAVHIPLHDLLGRLGDLPATRTVITVRRSGHRSARAAALLTPGRPGRAQPGSGMHAWTRAGLPRRRLRRTPGPAGLAKAIAGA